MKIELSKYFKEKGYYSAYIFTNNKNRKCVEIRRQHKINGKYEKRFISFAKYLWISENEMEVPEGYEVDHINGDGTDDRIENLQILTKHDNIMKEKIQNNKLGKLSVELDCPVCGKRFSKRLILIIRGCKFQPCCCSRKCSGILSSKDIQFNRDSYLDECKKKAYKMDKDQLTKNY